MNKEISPKIIALVFGVLVICFVIGFYAFAWVEPTSAPPGGNVDAPINVGLDPQSKEGEIGAALFRDSNNINYYVDPDGQTVLADNVGIGLGSGVDPAEKLDVGGGIKMGTTANTNAGTVRWTGTDFEGYDGSNWVSLTMGAGGGGDVIVVDGSDCPAGYSPFLRHYTSRTCSSGGSSCTAGPGWGTGGDRVYYDRSSVTNYRVFPDKPGCSYAPGGVESYCRANNIDRTLCVKD